MYTCQNMSEVLRPHRDILNLLTSEVSDSGMDPFEAYELFLRKVEQAELGFDTYGSTSITSGGHARDSSLNMTDIVVKNTRSAYDLCDELFQNGQLVPEQTIEAVAVGKIPHWNQSDYMEFWLSVMGRPEMRGHGVAHTMDQLREAFDEAKKRDDILDMSAYNNGGLVADMRASHYMRHADLFVDTLRVNANFSPITRLVRLIDTDQSLGAQTENYFAKVMGVRVMNVAIARIGDAVLPENYRNTQLERDTSSIVAFGGHIFDTVRRTELVLVEQP